MHGKRKRQKTATEHSQGKKRRTLDESQRVSSISHPVLSLYYPQVRSLRDHLLRSLPPKSRSRRRRIQAIPAWVQYCCIEDNVAGEDGALKGRGTAHVRDNRNSVTDHVQCFEVQNLSRLLDSTLIGIPRLEDTNNELKEQEPVTLSQQSSTAIGSSAELGTIPLSEVGNFLSYLPFLQVSG